MLEYPTVQAKHSIEQGTAKGFNGVVRVRECMYLKEYMEQVNEVSHASQDDHCCCHRPI